MFARFHLNDAKVLAETMQGGSVMTHQDNGRIRNPDDPWQREWGTGSMIAGIVAIVIMAGILAYGATRATDLPTGSASRLSEMLGPAPGNGEADRSRRSRIQWFGS